MWKRRYPFFLLLLAVVTIGFLISAGLGRLQPEYGRETLGHWVEQCFPVTTARFPPAAATFPVMPQSSIPTEVEEAIQQIGTNALPYLLNWIRYEPHPLKGKALT